MAFLLRSILSQGRAQSLKPGVSSAHQKPSLSTPQKVETAGKVEETLQTGPTVVALMWQTGLLFPQERDNQVTKRS
jgi:hypothetical protein